MPKSGSGQLNTRIFAAHSEPSWYCRAITNVSNRHDIPERFDLIFKTDGTQIPCQIVWRRDEQIGVKFD